MAIKPAAPKQATPAAQASVEKLAPVETPAPAPHPNTLSEAHGFPRERRCAQE